MLSATGEEVGAPTAGGTDSVIDVRGLCKSYGETRVMENVSFTVGGGEVFGYLGPNGAGKTTTVNIL
jgi:ABC-2 type transport system ATP-binding protein